MTSLTHRSSRMAWLWCVAYTALVPARERERRRREVTSHLWEAEQQRISSRRIAGATIRGVIDDLGWVSVSTCRAFAHSLTTPLPYVTAAGLVTVGGAFSSSILSSQRSGDLELASVIASPALLAIAGILWLANSRRS